MLSKPMSRCDWWSVSQSVSQSVLVLSPILWLMTTFLPLSRQLVLLLSDILSEKNDGPAIHQVMISSICYMYSQLCVYTLCS
jgi:hypothetical protein